MILDIQDPSSLIAKNNCTISWKGTWWTMQPWKYSYKFLMHSLRAWIHKTAILSHPCSLYL